MKNLITEIEKVTRVSNLNQMSWQEIVEKVVLPKMAGPRETRWCINDMFMNFVADNAYSIYITDKYLAGVLFEIALQRLSCGAVLHEPTSWPEPLPKQYWDYSSKWDEAHVMTDGCYNFLCKAMDACMKCEMTRSHALKVLLGLVSHISPNGSVNYGYLLPKEIEKNSVKLYAYAERTAEEFGTFEELYQSYARPEQWAKHKVWFADHLKDLDWDKFFKDTKCLKGNFFQHLLQRRAIKRELEKLSLPVAR